MSVHKNLTGADLHEPKGADTALTGQVYVANGSGSGVWTDATSVVTNTAFTTGDIKPTLKSTADTGWIFWSDNSTIGDGSSGATNRANSDTSALFTLLWTNFSNTLCPVSGGRGASAALDFAAHKTLTLLPGSGRAIGITGSGTGLTARTSGSTTGVETVTLTASQLPASIPYTDPGHIHTLTPARTSSTTIVGNTGTIYPGSVTDLTMSLTTNSATTGITINPSGGSSHTNMQPTVFLNTMIKL